MNFQAVRQANGNKVVMNAIATQIDGTSYTTSGTAKQECRFTDANGEQQRVSIWQGNGQPMPANLQGQTLSINISCKQSGNYMNYGGFWNSSAQVRQLAPPAQASQKGYGDASGNYQPRPPQAPPNTPAPKSNNKDRIIMAEIVYKELSGKFGDPNEFDIWLMGNIPIFKRHTDLIEQVGNNTLIHKTEPDAPEEAPLPYVGKTNNPEDDIPF